MSRSNLSTTKYLEINTCIFYLSTVWEGYVFLDFWFVWVGTIDPGGYAGVVTFGSHMPKTKDFPGYKIRVLK